MAIVGGGLCGLSLANFLRSRGVPAAVYEQRDTVGEIGAGVQVDPVTWRLLEGAGLSAGLAAIAERHTQGEMRYRMDGTPLADPEAESPALPYPCHRGDLVSALASGIALGDIHTGHRCVEYTQDTSGGQLRFDNGATADADVIVAADGIHSELRKYVTTPS
ncbi:MAG: FAD-dependent oxidoreductase, partial [Solirubrobacteraceae bacterium]